MIPDYLFKPLEPEELLGTEYVTEGKTRSPQRIKKVINLVPELGARHRVETAVRIFYLPLDISWAVDALLDFSKTCMSEAVGVLARTNLDPSEKDRIYDLAAVEYKAAKDLVKELETSGWPTNQAADLLLTQIMLRRLLTWILDLIAQTQIRIHDAHMPQEEADNGDS
jgi:hypothetical protein